MIDMQLEQKVARVYIRMKKSAKDRKLEFSISLKTLKTVLNKKKCYYTGIPISTWHDNENDNKLTIDRKDNSKGYIEGNVVACSHSFNQTKGALTLEEVQILAEKLL